MHAGAGKTTAASNHRAVPGVRDRILQSAEYLFGEQGYDATSIREIAGNAETRLGLVHYHFASKEELYERLIERRAAEMGERRLERLAAERRDGNGSLTVERIVRAYVWPFLEQAHAAGPGWRSYTRIISSVANSRRWNRLISTYYDPVARIFIDELRAVLPAARPDDLVFGFTFMVSAMLGAAAETGRTDDLSAGTAPSQDLRASFDAMLPFLARGFEGLASRGH